MAPEKGDIWPIGTVVNQHDADPHADRNLVRFGAAFAARLACAAGRRAARRYCPAIGAAEMGYTADWAMICRSSRCTQPL